MADLLVNYEKLNTYDENKLRTILFKNFKITSGVSQMDKDTLIQTILKENEKRNVKVIDEEVIYKLEEDQSEWKAKLIPESDDNDECVLLTNIDGDQRYELLEDVEEKFRKTRYLGFTGKDVVKVELYEGLVSKDKNIPIEEDGVAEEKVAKEIKQAAQIEEVVQDNQSPQTGLKTLKNEKSAHSAMLRIEKETLARFGYTSKEDDGYANDRMSIARSVAAEFKSTYGFDNLNLALDDIQSRTSKKPQQVNQAAKVSQDTSPKVSITKGASKSAKVRDIVENLIKSGTEFTSGTVMKKLEALHGETIHRSFCITIIKKVTG